jgi:hypothetical protein
MEEITVGNYFLGNNLQILHRGTSDYLPWQCSTLVCQKFPRILNRNLVNDLHDSLHTL